MEREYCSRRIEYVSCINRLHGYCMDTQVNYVSYSNKRYFVIQNHDKMTSAMIEMAHLSQLGFIFNKTQSTEFGGSVLYANQVRFECMEAPSVGIPTVLQEVSIINYSPSDYQRILHLGAPKPQL